MMDFNFTAPVTNPEINAAEDGARRAKENLARLAARYTFIVGTCALLHPKFPEMIGHLAPMLRENGKQLLVPTSVIGDLQRLVLKNPGMTGQVNELIGLLANLHVNGLVLVCGDSGELNSRKQIRMLAEGLLESSEPLVITQNNAFSEELVMVNRLRPSMSNRLAVSRVNHYGFLSRYIPQSGYVPKATGLDEADLSVLTAGLRAGA